MDELEIWHGKMLVRTLNTRRRDLTNGLLPLLVLVLHVRNCRSADHFWQTEWNGEKRPRKHEMYENTGENGGQNEDKSADNLVTTVSR